MLINYPVTRYLTCPATYIQRGFLKHRGLFARKKKYNVYLITPWPRVFPINPISNLWQPLLWSRKYFQIYVYRTSVDLIQTSSSRVCLTLRPQLARRKFWTNHSSRFFLPKLIKEKKKKNNPGQKVFWSVECFLDKMLHVPQTRDAGVISTMR